MNTSEIKEAFSKLNEKEKGKISVFLMQMIGDNCINIGSDFTIEKIDNFLLAVSIEANIALEKFPYKQNIFVNLSALAEEVGELSKSVLHYHYEPEKDDATIEHRKKEAIQVAVMAMRCYYDY